MYIENIFLNSSLISEITWKIFAITFSFKQTFQIQIYVSFSSSYILHQNFDFHGGNKLLLIIFEMIQNMQHS